MIRSNSFFAWGPALLFAAIVAWWLIASSGLFVTNASTLTVRNLAPGAISNIEIVLFGTRCGVTSLIEQRHAVCTFAIEGDSDYRVSWQEPGADRFTANIGYVARGSDVTHELHFLGGGELSFSSSSGASHD